VDVIEKLRPGAAAPGDIVHVDGTVLGRHDGIIGFTVGQRRGLHIAAGEPLYVVKLDAGANRVIVGPRAALAIRSLRLKEVNWIGPAVPAEGVAVAARVRSTRPPVPARLWLTDEGARVAFDTPEEGVAPARPACSIGASACWAAAGSPKPTRPDSFHCHCEPRRGAAIQTLSAQILSLSREAVSGSPRRGACTRGSSR
jgi:tRNA-specific 2-thiouridylase